MNKERQYKKYLKILVDVVEKAVKAIDVEMNKPSSVDRGRKIALISNYLELAKDEAKHFGLGEKL